MRWVHSTEMRVWDDGGGLEEKGRINKRKGRKNKRKGKETRKGVTKCSMERKVRDGRDTGVNRQNEKELLEAIKEGYKNNQENNKKKNQEGMKRGWSRRTEKK